ncbi:hypothetical protein [Nocardia brasiliensis]|uniref:hypothetical protein n=1 Tax=Nocardia brasiliensis TaxID=37326 RepID=UPI0024542B4A|nr:hypothetical protein [Nocardia brasiliensis]
MPSSGGLDTGELIPGRLSGGVVPGNGERIPGEAVHHPENNTVTATWTPARGARHHHRVRRYDVCVWT